MSQILAVLRKELIDGLRDKRSVMSALLFPLLAPMLVTFMLNLQAERQRESMDIDIPVLHGERAPDLVAWIERSGVGVVAAPEDPEAAVRDGVHDFVFVIPKDFNEDFAAGHTAEIELVHAGTKKDVGPALTRARGLVEGYSHNLGALRLIARGVSPQIARPIKIEDVDLASARQRFGRRARVCTVDADGGDAGDRRRDRAALGRIARDDVHQRCAGERGGADGEDRRVHNGRRAAERTRG